MKRVTWVLFSTLLAGGSGLLVLAQQPAIEGPQKAWRDLLFSAREQERRRGEQIVREEHDEVVEFLLFAVRRPVEPGEQFFLDNTPRNIAIKLLGDLRVKKAVPGLVDWLEPKEGQGVVIFEERILPPAGNALLQIGLPSVPRLLDIIRQKGCSSPYRMRSVLEPGEHVRFIGPPPKRTSVLGDKCLLIIGAIKGSKETEMMLRDALEGEKDGKTRGNLESALAQLADAPFAARIENLRSSRRD